MAGGATLLAWLQAELQASWHGGGGGWHRGRRAPGRLARSQASNLYGMPGRTSFYTFHTIKVFALQLCKQARQGRQGIGKTGPRARRPRGAHGYTQRQLN